MSESFTIGKSFQRAGQIKCYKRSPLDPVFRPLQIYATDPADSKLDGTRVIVNVPYEDLAPGPAGHLFEVVGKETDSQNTQPALDLNDPRVMCTQGLSPDPSAAFQMQMTYAVSMVTYDAFRRALGRDLHWGFDTPSDQPARLKLFPFYSQMNNAYYDRSAGAVFFGWYNSADRYNQEGLHKNFNLQNLRRGKVFASLSHDIIVHEVSHALLDGLRPNFLLPYHHNTLALHEGLADLIAILQHFSHRDLLAAAICKTRGNVSQSHLLTDLARQFGQTQSKPSLALRSAVDDYDCDSGECKPRKPLLYRDDHEIHDLGSVLVSSVFEAFSKVFERKVRKYIQISTHGTGVLPEGDLERSLAEVLAKEASELAYQFLGICIRAIDYCPPVSVTFGDYLRAMITADFDLVPSDPYGYREALVEAFIKRDIPIERVDTLSESALIWPTVFERVDKELLAFIQHENDDFVQMGVNPIQRYMNRAKVIGQYFSRPRVWKLLGLDDDPSATEIRPPCVESARIVRRVGPDGQLNMDLVIEINRESHYDFEGRRLAVIQGSTVIISSDGEIRYIISKDPCDKIHVTKSGSEKFPFGFSRLWRTDGSQWIPRSDLLAHLHGGS